MRVPRWKIGEVLKAYEKGEIKQLSEDPAGFSVPVRFFVLGITPRIVAEVIRAKKRGGEQ